MCYITNKGLVKSVAYHQTEVFEAGRTFAQTEGIIPAPETAPLRKVHNRRSREMQEDE